MNSIYFLRNYNVSFNILDKFTNYNIDLIDILVMKKEVLLDNTFPTSNINKVIMATKHFIMEVQQKGMPRIFDDPYMLHSVGVEKPKCRVFSKVNGIRSFKENYNKINWKALGMSGLASRFYGHILVYENNLGKSDVVDEWKVYSIFFASKSLSQEEVIRLGINESIINKLISKGAIYYKFPEKIYSVYISSIYDESLTNKALLEINQPEINSICYLLKYGIRYSVIKKFLMHQVDLIDVLILKKESLFDGTIVSYPTIKKVVEAVQLFLDDIAKNNINIFDDISILCSVGLQREDYKVLSEFLSISDYKIKCQTTNSVRTKSFKLCKYLSYVTDYETESSTTDKIKEWYTYLLFLEHGEIKSSSLHEMAIDIEILNNLTLKGAIGYDELESRYFVYKNDTYKFPNFSCSSNAKQYLTGIIDAYSRCENYGIDNTINDKKEILNKIEIRSKSLELKNSRLKKQMFGDIEDKEYSLDEFLSLPGEAIGLLKMKLKGETLEKIGNTFGVSREMIRQRLIKIKNVLPNIKEVQEHQNTYTAFNVSKEVFLHVFCNDARVYELLRLLFTKGDNNIEDELLNGTFGESARRYILSKSGKLDIEGVLSNNTRESILCTILKEYQVVEHYLTLEEIMFLYSEYTVDYPNLVVASERNFKAVLERVPNIIKSDNKGYRLYDSTILEENIFELKKCFERLSDGAYNMNHVVQKNPFIMRKMHIVDGSELHNILYKFRVKIPGVVLGRRPEFVKGKLKKNEYIFSELTDNMGMCVTDFVKLLNDNYGLNINSTLTYLSTHFKEYIKSGILSSPERSNFLSKLQTVSDLLDKDIYMPDEFYDIAKRLTKTETITPVHINMLGYKYRGSMIVKSKYRSSADAIKAHILKKRIIILDDSPIYKTSVFTAVCHNLEKEYRILRIGFNKFINMTFYVKEGEFTVNDLKSFVSQAEDYIEDNAYFTVASLLNSGFKNRLLDLGFEYITLDRLLCNSDKFSVVKKNYPTLFYKGNERNLHDFLRDKLIEYGTVDEELFVNEINTAYGLSFNNYDVRFKLEQQGGYYSKSLKKLYFDKEDYLKELFRYESI